jgi:tetratricopeptide (TPR) repeat protein
MDPVPPGNAKLAWWVAGGLLVVTLVALGYPVLTRGSSPAGGMGGGTAPSGMGGRSGGAGAVDLTTMTLEEQGTILFNRVMSSSSNGDVADVDFFLPKALIIYEQINPTDPDGLYHYALLYMVGEDYESALAKVREGLAQVPDYVLLLGVGGEAAIGLGDSALAKDFYTHLLEVYDTEVGMSRIGYDHHQPMFPAYRAAAEAFLSEG